jgi:CheY-like chemotaxis protein
LPDLAPFMLLPPSMRNTAKKILIVDSNDSFRESLRAFIQSLGHEVFEADTGPEAIEKVSSIHPDLIIMDVQLPGMNGDEVTARLKRNMSTRNIPVIINSGWPPPATLKSGSIVRSLREPKRSYTSRFNCQCCVTSCAPICSPRATIKL